MKKPPVTSNPSPRPTYEPDPLFSSFMTTAALTYEEPPLSFWAWRIRVLRRVKIMLRDHTLLREIPSHLNEDQVRTLIKLRLTFIQAVYEMSPHVNDDLEDWIILAIHSDRPFATAVWTVLRPCL